MVLYHNWIDKNAFTFALLSCHAYFWQSRRCKLVTVQGWLCIQHNQIWTFWQNRNWKQILFQKNQKETFHLCTYKESRMKMWILLNILAWFFNINIILGNLLETFEIFTNHLFCHWSGCAGCIITPGTYTMTILMVQALCLIWKQNSQISF